MRKLKLQVQISVDGFVCGPNGELDWMTWDWDDKLKSYGNELTDSVNTILLGRKMTEGFINYWTDVVENKPDSDEYPFAKKMVDYQKVVFTKTLNKSEWNNTVLAKGDLVDEISKLKKQDGNDLPTGQAGIIVYGGATFVSALIKQGLIDEFHLFINPAAIGRGLTIFNDVNSRQKLKLIKSNSYECGIVVNQYIPQ